MHFQFSFDEMKLRYAIERRSARSFVPMAKPEMSKMPASATGFSSTSDIVMGNGLKKIYIRKCTSPSIPGHHG
jgi:hypothetical protein